MSEYHGDIEVCIGQTGRACVTIHTGFDFNMNDVEAGEAMQLLWKRKIMPLKTGALSANKAPKSS